MAGAFIPKERLTAFQRWELGAIDGANGERLPADPHAIELGALRAHAHAEGHREGYEAGAAVARAQVEQLRRIVAAAQTELEAIEQRIAGDVLELALEVARQVLRAEVKARREGLLAVVREALASLPQPAGAPQLALNPGDVDAVRAHVGDELQGGGFRIVEDHRIEPGGCRITAPSCEVDATMATRWKRVVAALGSKHGWTDA